MSPLLEVRDLTVRFGATTVVSQLSFAIEPGECLALVGESGSGKSVTARTLLGLTGAGSTVSASALRFDGVDLMGASSRMRRRLRGPGMGLISQGALVALDPLRPVGREIADPLRIRTALTGRRRQEKVVELLAEAGVPDPALRASQRPDQLSGGLRQRAVIASAVALRPRLLIADEPTTALDTGVQAGILDLLERLRSEGAALLLISHDLAVVSRLASRLVVMRAGTVVESGPVDEVLAAPRHPYTRRLIAAAPAGRPRGSRLVEPPRGTPDAPEVVEVVDAPHAPGAPGAPTAQPDPRREPVLEATRLVRRFGERLAVDGVSFALPRGRTLGVVGESGSGKTTLARMALALDRPDSGEVLLLGESWSAADERERRRRRPRIGAIYQDALSSFDPRMTVGRILADALSHGRSLRPGAEVAELLRQVGLPEQIARRRPRHLSGGQQQRVAIARALAPRPDVIVCDEPVSSLDVSVQAQVLDLLDELQRSHGLSYLFISHDLGVVRHMSDEVIVMRSGRVVESGDAEAVFSAPRHEYTRALIASAPRIHRRTRQRSGDPS